MIDVGLTILLIWHVSSVVTWISLTYYFVFLVSPSLRKMSLDEKVIYLYSFISRFSKVISGAAVSALLGGTFLVGYVTSVDTYLEPVGWRLILIILGAILGLVCGFITLGVMLPLSTKISKQGLLAVSARTLVAPTSPILGKSNDYSLMLKSILSTLAVLLSCTALFMVLSVYI